MKRILDVIEVNECIHCETLKEAEEYCNIADEQGLRWNSGYSYKEKNEWYPSGMYTVYYPHKGTFGFLFFKDEEIHVISFEEFKNRLTE